ncbi:MAG: hypothetical protein KF901_24145 [Myxococcales bacterium]|nr:hypothetical protein [Myxococcales bacterium]
MSEAPKKPRFWRPTTDPAKRPAAALTAGTPAGGEGPLEVLPKSWAEMRGFVDELRAKVEARDAESLLGVARRVLTLTGERVRDAIDADRAIMLATSATIELAASRYALDPGAQWEPGQPLKVLLAGYSGTRNTGADVRVEEMIRQFRHLFGDEHVELSIFTIDPELTRGYFRTVRQLHIPKLFPKFLYDTIHEQHAVIACEGSMFKSKFANALSAMMVGSLGLASVEGKIAVGYGGEAGGMDRPLADLVRRYCQDALIIARNEASKEVLAELGVASRSGTDTAWTFDPAPAEVGRKILVDAGWDGATPVLALCPINPFWWPVTPNVPRAVLRAVGDLDAELHYGSVYFHRGGAEVDDQQDAYLEAWANAVARFLESHEVFPVMFGSEQLDRRAGEALSEKLVQKLEARGLPVPTLPSGERGFPVVVSDDHDMYAMVSAMRQATYMVSSRYHAIVMTMAGGVVSAGVTMDERIRNLMKDRRTPELALECDQPDLEDALFATLERLVRDADAIREGIDACVYDNLVRMGEMGMVLVDYVRARHPELPFRPELGEHGDPWDHLPALPPAVRALVGRVEARRASERPASLVEVAHSAEGAKPRAEARS